jgi:hypothetical protein
MNFKSTLVCLGLIAGSTLAFPTASHAATFHVEGNTGRGVLRFGNNPREIEYITILTNTGDVTATALVPGVSTVIGGNPAPLSLGIRNIAPFKSNKIRRLILQSKSGSVFKAQVKTVPEPSTTLGGLALAALSSSLLRSRKQRKSSQV